MEKELVKRLAKNWVKNYTAPIVCQKEIGGFTGGLMSKQTLANLCSKGEGPKGKFYVRGAACWETEVIVPWLLKTLTTEKRPAVREVA